MKQSLSRMPEAIAHLHYVIEVGDALFGGEPQADAIRAFFKLADSLFHARIEERLADHKKPLALASSPTLCNWMSARVEAQREEG